tara:strand:+ start:666 stop:854 length:189 start_codon:yes stop_codon:yes gene_type:complete
MNIKLSPFAIQDKNLGDLNNEKEYPTLSDLMKDQGVSTDLSDYSDKEYDLNQSNQDSLVYED